MNKKILLPMVVFIMASVFSFFALLQGKDGDNNGNAKKENEQTSQIILFYGDGCPHCKIVEEYLQKNDPSNKLAVVQKEVWEDQSNKKEFIEKARVCGLDTGDLGVPMLWDQKNSKCYMGDQPIIDFLNQISNKPR